MDLSHIMGVLGHELRTPLAAILGYYELLAEGVYGDIDERQREAVNRIGQSAHQLLGLIDGIQELATGGTAEDDDPEPFDAAAIVRSVHDRLDGYAAARRVQVHLDTPGSVMINGVESRFVRLVDMIFAAAIKSSAGCVLHARLEAGPAFVRLVVPGTGLDLQRDAPAHVRTDRNEQKSFTGAALRLAIAEQAAELAGGRLELARENGHVCVTVELPRDAAGISRD